MGREHATGVGAGSMSRRRLAALGNRSAAGGQTLARGLAQLA